MTSHESNSEVPTISRASVLQWLSPLWLLPAAVLLFWNLSYAPLWNPDEGRYASAALEMAQPFSSEPANWIVPHLNTVPRLNKPPLVYWVAAACFKLFGTTTAAARLPSVLAALGVLLIVWQMGRRMFSARTGVLAALVWATSTLPFVLSHTLNTDMLLTFTMSLAIFGLWLLSEAKAQATVPCEKAENEKAKAKIAEPLPGALLAGLGLGLAMLAKGPVGVVLPLGIWGLWLLITRGRQLFSAIPWSGMTVALVVGAAIATPWYVAIARLHPAFLKSFLFGENLARLTGSQFYHKPQSPFFYLPILLIGLFPWSVFLIPAIARLRSTDTADAPVQAEASTPVRALSLKSNLWFLWLWAIAVVGLFSISHVKLITYILPAFPALALLISEVLTPRREHSVSVSRALIWASYITAALLLILAAALPSAFFRSHGLADKLMPIEEIAPYVWVLTAVSVILAGLLVFAFSRRAAPLIAVGAAAIFAILLAAAGQAALYEDSSSISIALKPHLKPGDELIQFKTFDPTAIFYFGQPMTVVNVENRSGWDEQTFQSSPLFPHDDAAARRIIDEANRTGRRIFVLTKWKHAHFPAVKDLHLIASTNDYRLLSNQPAPAGFKHEYLAPRQRKRKISPECKAFSPLC